MKILNKKLWTGLTALGTVALVTTAAVFGGIEWALASLGMISLVAMIGAGISIAVRVSKYSGKSAFEEYINYEIPSYYWNDENPENAADITEEIVLIDKKEKKYIVKHIDELFGLERVESSRRQIELAPVSRQDKKSIMAQIDELFTTNREQNLEMFS